MFLVNWYDIPSLTLPAACSLPGRALTKRLLVRRFYGILNSLGLYNKNAKILFLVRPLNSLITAGIWRPVVSVSEPTKLADRAWTTLGRRPLCTC